MISTIRPQTIEESEERFRHSLPADKCNRKLDLWKMIKDSVGKDFSKITMPIVLNEPLSAVQRVCEDLEASYLLTVWSSRA
jgi:hypothetical protein